MYDQYGVELTAAAVQFPVRHPVVAAVVAGTQRRTSCLDVAASVGRRPGRGLASKYGDWPNSPMVTKKAPLGHIFTPNLAGGFQGLTKNTLNLALPPVDKAGDKTATFANASSYLSMSTRVSDPAAAAEFINWFVNGQEAALTLRLISGPPASSAGMDALLQSANLTDAEKAVLDFTKMALSQVESTPEPSPGGDVAVQALLLKASQDIAFKKASVAEASKKFFSDAAKALSQ